MSIGRHRLQIADAEVTGAGAEEIAEREGGERRVATGAPATNGGALGIDQTALDQILGAIDVVVDVDEPPRAIQPLPVGAAVASAAAVVDVEDRKSTRYPELVRQAERGLGAAGRSAMTLHEQWWQLTLRRDEVLVPR